MAPTIHGLDKASSSSAQRSSGRREEKKQDFNCRVKYYNTLPDVPFEPKFLSYPFDPNRFVKYKPTSLEKNHKWELLTEADLGVQVDLVNPDAYAVNISPHLVALDPVDEKLLEEEPVNAPDTKRSKQHSRAVSWMRKTEYISSEFNRYGTQTERKETKLGYNIKKKLKEEEMYRDRESQLQAIQRTFEDVKTPVTTHYSKPNVVAIQEMPLFPDFDLWQFPFAQVIFDADPAPLGVSPDVQTEQMSQALIRGMMDESGEQFVAYFLPTEPTLQQRNQDAEDGLLYLPSKQYDYKLAREYNWTVKNKASKGYEENYFFVFRNNGVYYNELETRVRLSRRRVKEGIPKVVNSRLLVTHREQNEQEAAAQNARMMQLQTLQEEEEAEAVAEQEQAQAAEVSGEEKEQEQEQEEGDETVDKQEDDDDEEEEAEAHEKHEKEDEDDEQEMSEQSSD